MKTVEFSMDGGETWTSFDVGDVDPAKWLWWSFTFTPEKEGAYVLSVRGTDVDGRSELPQPRGAGEREGRDASEDEITR